MKKSAFFLIAVLLVLLVSMFTGSYSSQNQSSLTGAKDLFLNETPTASATTMTIQQVAGELPDWTIDEWYSHSDVVATVHVDNVGTARYNTSTGAKPTEDVSSTLKSVSLSQSISRPVTLSVTSYFKAADPAVTGYVTKASGGTINDVRETSSSGDVFHIDDEGVVFLILYNSASNQELPPTMQFLRELADSMSQQPALALYNAAGLMLFYRFDGDNAVEALSGDVMQKADLLAQLQNQHQ